MSWHTSALFMRSSKSADVPSCLALLKLDNPQETHTASFDEACGSNIGGRAYANVQGWHIVFDPYLFADLEVGAAQSETLLPSSLEAAFEADKCEVMYFVLEGSSGTAGFARYKAGKRIRCLLVQDDNTIFDEGKASVEEREAFSEHSDDAEQAVLALTGKVTLDWALLSDVEFTIHAI